VVAFTFARRSHAALLRLMTIDPIALLRLSALSLLIEYHRGTCNKHKQLTEGVIGIDAENMAFYCVWCQTSQPFSSSMPEHDDFAARDTWICGTISQGERFHAAHSAHAPQESGRRTATLERLTTSDGEVVIDNEHLLGEKYSLYLNTVTERTYRGVSGADVTHASVWVQRQSLSNDIGGWLPLQLFHIEANA
jgi:hypothetical protein